MRAGTHHLPAFPGGLDGPATTAVVKESLEALGLPSVDLMLIHFPAAWNGTGGENRVVKCESK